MVLDSNQINTLIYQLDCKGFFKDIIRKRKVFYKWCEDNPEGLRSLVENWIIQLSKPELSKHLNLKLNRSK